MTDGLDEAFEAWRALVARGPGGVSPESLTSRTADGLAIEPLYVERDRPQTSGVPWHPPPHRGVGAVGGAGLLGELESERAAGATLAWARDSADALLSGVRTAPEGLAVVLEPRGHVQTLRAGCSQGVRLLCDPFSHLDEGASRSESDPHPLLDAMADALARGGAPLGASTLSFHEGHTSAVDGLAVPVASFIASLRGLEARGIAPSLAASGATFALACGTDVFLEVARLRALRRVIAKVLDACGVSERPALVARSSFAMVGALDEATNVLRATLATSAALIGGADHVGVVPHDVLRGATPRGRRLARNTGLVLDLEAFLGRTADPARGSYFVESLTDTLASAVWAVLQDVERRGGIEAARPWLAERRARADEAHAKAVATRAIPFVGSSRFPREETLGPIVDHGARDAIPFEALRHRGRDHEAALVVLEGCPEARVEFAREVAAMAADSVRVVRDPAEAASLRDESFVILCAPDSAFGGEAVERARTLSSGGRRAVAVAGRPGAHRDALRSAGVVAWVHLGADLVEALEALLGPQGSPVE